METLAGVLDDQDEELGGGAGEGEGGSSRYSALAPFLLKRTAKSHLSSSSLCSSLLLCSLLLPAGSSAGGPDDQGVGTTSDVFSKWLKHKDVVVVVGTIEEVSVMVS
jgi:hypothetical protein